MSISKLNQVKEKITKNILLRFPFLIGWVGCMAAATDWPPTCDARTRTGSHRPYAYYSFLRSYCCVHLYTDLGRYTLHNWPGQIVS